MATQETINRIKIACRESGFEVYQLFSMPLDYVVLFAAQRGIAVEELAAVCGLLVEQLDQWSSDLDIFGKLNPH